MAVEFRDKETCRRADEMIAAIFSGFMHPVLVKDEHGVFVYVNQAATNLIGFPFAEIVGRTDYDFLSREQAERVLEVDRAVFATGKEQLLEETITSRAGETRTFVTHKHCVTLPAEYGNRRLLVALITDVTQLRKAERAQRESEAFIRSIFDSSPDCVRLLALNGEPLLMNRAGRALFGISDDADLRGHEWTRMALPEEAPKIQAAFAEVRAGNTARFEASIRTPEGQLRCMDVIAAPVRDNDGNPVRMLAIWRDITEAKAARDATESARRAAEKAAKRLASVLETTMDCVIVADRQWRLRYMNSNAQRLLGLGDEAIGQSLGQLYPEEADGAFAAHCRKAMASQEPMTFEEYVASLGMWLEVHSAPTEEGLSIFFRDMSARRKAEQERFQALTQIYHMSRHDALTNLPNRVLFRERLERELEELKPEGMLAALTLDLDGFKAVNDSYGHPVGDLLLRQVGDRLRACVRETDTIARLGGDEFVVIQAGLRNADDVSLLADRIIRALERPFELDALSLSIGASVGFAIAPEAGTNADQLIRASDIALYRAKSEGRGIYRRYIPSMDASLQARQELKVALKSAILRQELELHFQPVIGLDSNKVTSCEALVRWRHPQRGLIPPADFIPLAEESGLIMAIGEWVLQKACREAMTWPQAVGVAVNLSPVQFKNGDLVKVVARALESSGLAADRLQLEITESVMLDESDSNMQILQEIRLLGVKIAMDDFGTGYSSLGYLRTFPFDKIKVDRAFVSDLPDGRESLAIVRAVAGIGRSLGITTTVEGVETREQLAAVNKEGFDEAQGYLFSRPVPAPEIAELLRGIGIPPAAQFSARKP
jgi:diguanylate cyclase (GGDEF)-like protein/PAS domain S-box-containing protein